MTSTALIDAGGLTATGPDTPVPWWSFTKTALAVAALRLEEQGAMELDAPMGRAPWSLRQLLRHESGLPDYGGLPAYHAAVAAGDAPWPVEDMLAAARAQTPLFRPGAGWAYSNIGYLKVGEAVAAASGLPLGEALAQWVFRPAGLTTARLVRAPEDLAGVRTGDAAGYHPGWVYHGLIVGTVADAARLLTRVVCGRLLAPASLAAMRDGHALPQFRSEAHPDPAYGLGLMMPGGDLAGHTGDGPGSQIAVYAAGGRTAAAWTASSDTPQAEAAVRKMLV